MKGLFLGLVLCASWVDAQTTVTVTGDGAATVVTAGTQGPAGLTPSAVGMLYNVKDYGATGDGTTNDTAAIQAAIAAATAGGRVFLPPGVYQTAGSITLAAGVALEGSGAGSATIRGTAGGSVIRVSAVAGFALRDLTVTTNATLGIIGIYVVDSSLGSIRNVDVVGATYAGVFIEDSADITLTDVTIRDVKMASGSVGGTGLHLFDNVTRVVVSGLIVDGTDGDGIWLDAQTDGGIPRPITDSTFNGLVARNYGRVLRPSVGFGTHGAQRCTGSGWVIGPAYLPTTAQNYGVMLNIDQNGTPTTDCVFSDISIANVGMSAIQIRSSQRNQLSNVRIVDPDGVLLNYAVIFTEGTVTAPAVLLDNTDNTIDGLDIATSGAPYSANYNRAVLFNASAANCHRNRVLNLRPGSPLDVPIFWNGANAPASGVNANVASYLDPDGVTTQHTGGIGASALTLTPKAFLVLGSPASGTVYYCTDCTEADPCAGSGTGALAKRLNGRWDCN